MSGSDAALGFDFHCHIDLHRDPTAVIRECESKRIIVVAVTTTPHAWGQNNAWTKGSDYVHAAVGLHPELVEHRYSELALLERRIGDTRLVGEVGLDASPRHRQSQENQKLVFGRVLDASQKHGGRVVTIHSRRAARDVITMIDDRVDPKDVICILHWFSGTIAEAQRAVAAGCYFSVNSAMLKHERNRALLRTIPRDRLLTETDSPFTKTNSRTAMPWDSTIITEGLAELYDESHLLLKNQVTANAKHVLSFAGI